MMNLKPVFDPKTLSHSKVYLIDCTQYRYVRTEGSGKHIKYVFAPLPNQRKSSEISLNSTKLGIRCQEVVGMNYEQQKEQIVVQIGLL
ncbi:MULTISPECIES: hypothetical protein [Nostocales]|uniref:hypothetical protein n=1 Tax=Nostocales TaxID=1161 RepID=UPI0016861158|nr:MULTISPECIES: hypothetical protein [Nostocales]MBD2303895.1 hypothetical protein [Nostoc sp. FACHB-190]MBD2492164.1 hypothetical protein [Aulosira sp. FACHB-615]